MLPIINSLAATAGQAQAKSKWGGWLLGVGIWFLPLLWTDFTTYLVLTIAGVTMGMLLFVTASGFTVILGLMDVINLAHGAVFAWGGYLGFSIMQGFAGWIGEAGLGGSLGAMLLALAAAGAVGWVLGVLMEWIIIRRTYGSHLKQILITMGTSLVMIQLIIIVWGPNNEVMPVPGAFRGSIDLGNVIIERFRILCLVVGGLLFTALYFLLQKTKLGIIVRAGVENREVVQTLGHNIRKIFTHVFAAGAALAAVGGAMWAVYSREIMPGMGDENLIFALIVVVVGGMGSVTGCFLASIMVGLAFNYVAYSVPSLALGVNIMIMAVVLMLKPSGLLGRE